MTVVTRSIPPQHLIDLLNPAVRILLRAPLHGLADGALVLLTVTGRRTGRQYTFPVAYVDVDGRLLVVSQHAWRANLRGGADVEIVRRGRTEMVRADLEEDPDTVAAAISGLVTTLGSQRVQRWSGLRITGSDGGSNRVSEGEVARAVREFDLALITLSPVTTQQEHQDRR